MKGYETMRYLLILCVLVGTGGCVSPEGSLEHDTRPVLDAKAMPKVTTKKTENVYKPEHEAIPECDPTDTTLDGDDGSVATYECYDAWPQWAHIALREVLRVWEDQGQKVSPRCLAAAQATRIEVWDRSHDSFCWEPPDGQSIGGCVYVKDGTGKYTINHGYDQSFIHVIPHEFTHILTWCEGVEETGNHEGKTWNWLKIAQERLRNSDNPDIY